MPSKPTSIGGTGGKSMKYKFQKEILKPIFIKRNSNEKPSLSIVVGRKSPDMISEEVALETPVRIT